MDLINNSLEMVNEATSKFVLCVLLTQLGKTFTAISKILAEIEQDDE
jgi:ERCC4-related helicase